jgi:hypothetical protein
MHLRPITQKQPFNQSEGMQEIPIDYPISYRGLLNRRRTTGTLNPLHADRQNQRYQQRLSPTMYESYEHGHTGQWEPF